MIGNPEAILDVPGGNGDPGGQRVGERGRLYDAVLGADQDGAGRGSSSAYSQSGEGAGAQCLGGHTILGSPR